jgi:ribA/ribD-fused uncharacterized protein
MNEIIGFRGRYFFLSNFFSRRVIIDDFVFKNNEAAFQSHKPENIKLREFFCWLEPSEAKKAGKKVKLRKDWESIKEEVMYKVVLAKFTQNFDLRNRLLMTGDMKLIEENNWGDTTWGTVDGEGKNLLGNILMRVRKEIRISMGGGGET